MSDFFLRRLKNKEALVFSPTFLFLDRGFANFSLYSLKKIFLRFIRLFYLCCTGSSLLHACLLPVAVSRSYSLVAVLGLLIAVVSLVAGHRL